MLCLINITLKTSVKQKNYTYMKKTFIVLLSTFLISSCATVYYPSHVNSSFIENKGETTIGGALSLTSLNAQASTAINDHLRLAAGVNYWGWSASLGSANVGGSGLHTQLLAGYYKKLGNKIFFEGYGGIGTTVGSEDFFSHGIIQPSIGFGKDQPKFIISLRANYLTNSLFSDPDNGLILGPDETNKKSGMFSDLAFTHKFNRANKTWFIQYGISNDAEKIGDTELIPFMNFGVNFRLFSKK
jgi:hypothetical protein